MAITLRRLFRNYISLIGGILAGLSFIVNVFLLFLDFLSPTQNPYVGIITYMILPGVTLTGLGLVFGGAALRFFQLRRGAVVVELPKLDLSNPRHRYALFGTFLTIILFLGLSAVGGYESYHYTDSVAFCGTTCHTVMEPEYTAYQNSAHARVACVSCHIGPGAEWYVRSKINGAYQVYSVLFDKYSRGPFPRPSATCARPRTSASSATGRPSSGASNWPRGSTFPRMRRTLGARVDLLIKTGGGGQHGINKGIHWHMNIANKVFYVAADEKRQVIPWVKTEGPNGEVVEYVSTEKPSLAGATEEGRSAPDGLHGLSQSTQPPIPAARSGTGSLVPGREDLHRASLHEDGSRSRPWCSPSRPRRRPSGGSSGTFGTFYAKAYPNVLKDSEAKLRDAIAEVQRVYRQNFFPQMRVNWQAYPENIGHKEFPGCFRCHEGKHVSKDGRVIRNDCAACHDFLERRKGGAFVRAEATAAFAHPWKLGGKHARGPVRHLPHRGADEAGHLSRLSRDRRLGRADGRPCSARSATSRSSRSSRWRAAPPAIPRWPACTRSRRTRTRAASRAMPRTRGRSRGEIGV